MATNAVHKRLIQSISLNPSRTGELNTHLRELSRESHIRKAGFWFLLIALGIQLIALLFPPTGSVSYSDNHLANGTNNRTNLLQAWDQQNSSLPEIYLNFGISRTDLERLPQRPNSTVEATSNNNFWALSRMPLSGRSDGFKEIAIESPHTTTYLSPLDNWNKNKHTHSYPAFAGKSRLTGKPFWILAGSGTYVQIGSELGLKPPVKPSVAVRKSLLGGQTKIQAGQTISYLVEYRNETPNSLAESARLSSPIDGSMFEFVSASVPSELKNDIITTNLGDLPHSTYPLLQTITLRAKHDTTANALLCSATSLSTENADTAKTADCKTPVLGACTPTCATSPSRSQEVHNLSQNSERPARAGDTIEYKLVTTNSQATSIDHYTVTDYIGDLLDYAELDRSFLASLGGIYDQERKEIRWENQTINPQSQTINTFRITLKNPLPNTNQPSGVTTSFDCILSNKYGNETALPIACPLVKRLESFANIRPIIMVLTSLLLVVMSLYFYLRSIVLEKELRIIRKMYRRGI